MRDTLRRACACWAVDSRSDEGHGLLGVGCWGWDVPAHTSGCRVALFGTREEARRAAEKVRGTWPRARAVRVSVAIEAVGAAAEVPA